MNLDDFEIFKNEDTSNLEGSPEKGILIKNLPEGKYSITIKHEKGIQYISPVHSKDITSEIVKCDHKIEKVFYAVYVNPVIYDGGTD